MPFASFTSRRRTVGTVHERLIRGLSVALFLVVALGGCAAPPGQQAGTGVQSQGSDAPRPSRTMRLVTRLETPDLAPKSAESGGGNDIAKRLFNAQLVLLDAQVMAHPYLAEALPEPNTDSWKVFPDGRMETTYRLRPNLTWQDGAPLTTDDCVFAYRVYKDRGLGVFIASPQDTMDAVTAPDPRTLVIQWRSPNPDGGSLTFQDF